MIRTTDLMSVIRTNPASAQYLTPKKRTSHRVFPTYHIFRTVLGVKKAGEEGCGRLVCYQAGRDNGSFIQEGKTVFERNENEIRQVVNFQLLHQDRAVFFHGLGADAQDLCGGLVGMSLDDKLKYLPFAG